MDIQTSKSKPLLEQALNARALRQDLISGNIANIDTPFYKAKDIDFETMLIQQTKEIYGERGSTSPKLAMAQTDASHLRGYTDFDNSKATLYLRDGHMARNDGNTVDRLGTALAAGTTGNLDWSCQSATNATATAQMGGAGTAGTLLAKYAPSQCR